ncbi:MAG: hypothetical protein ABS882_14465 [Lysinibacillus sp.]
MIKNVIEWFILIWTGLLVVLISGWICIEFYNLNVEIMAALIAFLGAIIGGFITLFGVRRTINENQKLNFKNRIPEKVVNAEKICRMYNEIYGIYFLNDLKVLDFNPSQAKERVNNLYKENDAESKALQISPDAYEGLKWVRNSINLLTIAFNQKVHREKETLTEEKIFEYKRKLIDDCGNLTYKALWTLEQEQKEYLEQYH